VHQGFARIRTRGHFWQSCGKKNAFKSGLVVDIEKYPFIGGKKARIFITPAYNY
jgi:hypothetical protein